MDSDSYDGKGATAQIMKAIHEYGIACVNLHIRGREGFGNVEDERKHQQALWCAIRDMVDNEIALLRDAHETKLDAPREWIQSEESMRGAPLREVLKNNCVTIIWHHKKPETSNPVWEVVGQ